MTAVDFWAGDLPDEKARVAYTHYVMRLPEIKKFKDYLEKQLEDIRKSRLGKSQYDKPSWAYLQADLNGKESEILRLLNLLTID